MLLAMLDLVDECRNRAINVACVVSAECQRLLEADVVDPERLND